MSLIDLRRGDDATRTVTVTRDGVALSLTDAQAVTFTAKRQADDPDSDAVIRKELDDGLAIDEVDSNVATITFDAADTDDLECPAVFVYDVEIIDAEGKRETVAIGYLRLLPDVTREVTVGS